MSSQSLLASLAVPLQFSVGVAAAVVLYVLMIGFFAVVVLPRSRVSAARVGAIRRDWAVSAGAYLLVLVPVVTVVTGVLGGA